MGTPAVALPRINQASLLPMFQTIFGDFFFFLISKSSLHSDYAVCVIVWAWLLSNPGCTAVDNHEFLSFLPPRPKCWNYSYLATMPAFFFLGCVSPTPSIFQDKVPLCSPAYSGTWNLRPALEQHSLPKFAKWEQYTTCPSQRLLKNTIKLSELFKNNMLTFTPLTPAHEMKRQRQPRLQREF